MTSVEWLIDKICGEHTEAWQQEIQQAIIIEKQQIIKAYDKGYEQGYNDATREACQEIAKNYQPNDR